MISHYHADRAEGTARPARPTIPRSGRCPRHDVDATTLTEAGYVGADGEKSSSAPAAAGGDSESASRIIYIAKSTDLPQDRNRRARETSRAEGVPQALLKSGSTVDHVPRRAGASTRPGVLQIDSNDILFICVGAFVASRRSSIAESERGRSAQADVSRCRSGGRTTLDSRARRMISTLSRIRRRCGGRHPARRQAASSDPHPAANAITRQYQSYSSTNVKLRSLTMRSSDRESARAEARRPRPADDHGT